MTSAQRLEVRAVWDDDFAAVFPLLQLFKNAKMSRSDWQQMLFANPWGAGRERGYVLQANGEPVGFIGTIFATRKIFGHDELVCNTSSWIVREEYRNASLELLKPVLALRDCTIVNLTPTERSYEVFSRLGFRELEREKLILFPLASPKLWGRRSFSAKPERFLDELSSDQRDIVAGLAGCTNVTALQIRSGERTCFLVATPLRIKRVRFAEVQHIEDPTFLMENRALVHFALLKAMRALGLVIDARFVQGSRVSNALRRPAKRLYRPARPDLSPEVIDGLFSELMTLKI